MSRQIVWAESQDDVCYLLEIEQEDQPVRGNAVHSGDEAVDQEVEDEIIEALESGNQWAWCCAICTALQGEWKGQDFLGGCSYRDTQEFILPGGYWEDMKAEALRSLEQAKVKAVVEKLTGAGAGV